ncbi:MAG: 2-phospho-L-lactate guanylyltransferase [Chloroflexota bacterium]|nr:2-phospho-L-lactate guanylyltransferase [Chloroflexota bacterium]
MIAALVPAKALDQAKGRLAAILGEDERRQLALAMLKDVVSALEAVAAIESVAVVSPDADVLALASRLGAATIEEPANVRGINQALTHALGVMSPEPEALVVVLADVPEIDPAAVATALQQLPERGLVICPSHDKGTGLLAMRPAGVIPFRFGPQSFSLHKREAAAQGLRAEVVRAESLARDIDSPDDLRALLGRSGDTATHHLLARLDIAARAG